MRFIDIDSMVLPNGWQARADQALNDLRHEILQAEAAAEAAGTDRAAARKRAIASGLEIPARRNLWAELKPMLGALSNDKCWYSESKNPAADKNVDHFRPKGRVADEDNHEGYWWLAFSRRNFRYASQWANQRRVDSVGRTRGGKWDHFPLQPGSVRAMHEADDIDLENPELLDPIDPDDWKLLAFRPDGHSIPAKPSGTPAFDRAQKSIEIYHLDCKELVDGRRAMAGRIQRLVQDLERLRPKIEDPKLRAVYKSQQIELLRALNSHSEYSAAALAYARAEIYTLESGHQLRREWLEAIFN